MWVWVSRHDRRQTTKIDESIEEERTRERKLIWNVQLCCTMDEFVCSLQCHNITAWACHLYHTIPSVIYATLPSNKPKMNSQNTKHSNGVDMWWWPMPNQTFKNFNSRYFRWLTSSSSSSSSAATQIYFKFKFDRTHSRWTKINCNFSGGMSVYKVDGFSQNRNRIALSCVCTSDHPAISVSVTIINEHWTWTMRFHSFLV